MLIVKLMKFDGSDPGVPTYTTGISLREAAAVHVRYEPGLRAVLQLGDAPGETMDITVGAGPDCAYSVAYIMNASGKTVETIR